MAFNPLTELQYGNVDFVFQFPSHDLNILIMNVRAASNRIVIINGFLPKLKNTHMATFCFSIIYDIPEFANEAYELLDVTRLTPEMLDNLLTNSPLGLRVLNENFEFLISKEDEMYFMSIAKFAFKSNNRELIHKLSRYHNLHIRYLFMSYLIIYYPSQIDKIYDDITKYLTSVTYEPNEQLALIPSLMNSEDISKLAVLLLTHNRLEYYIKIKNFILTHYDYNFLASELLNEFVKDPFTGEYYIDPKTSTLIIDPKLPLKKEYFSLDADRLFSTSQNYRLELFSKYKNEISQELLDLFRQRIKFFLTNGDGYRDNLSHVYLIGLGRLVEEWAEEYMEKSLNKEYGFIGGGTTCNCYRIGDYVIKLVRFKWSYEPIICPNLYLVARNYEEIYLRDASNHVYGGIEVQRYLNSASNVSQKYYEYFSSELDKIGYRINDSLTRSNGEDNVMLLNTYRDADCRNPENLPDWFKETPLVLVDRDRIYKKGAKVIRQIPSRY